MIAPLHDLSNRPLGSLRVSVTDRCNLRCAYCMPPEGLDWLPANSADNWLHFALGVVLLGAGLLLGRGRTATV